MQSFAYTTNLIASAIPTPNTTISAWSYESDPLRIALLHGPVSFGIQVGQNPAVPGLPPAVPTLEHRPR